MSASRQRRVASLSLVLLIALTLLGWIAGRQIRSPAQVAADTAAPAASPITVPVNRRTLSTNVIVRGTVRYGAPQAVTLATSRIKQGSDIVTQPPRRRAELSSGEVAMSVDGRPVFVLRGAIPMHRDLGPGDRGPDVRQLERELSRLGFRPGAVDGRYDSATEAAVSAFYIQRGWDPFGPTDVQLDQLRTAEAAAAQARDAQLQAVNAVEQAQKTVRPTEITQAKLDLVNAREALAGAQVRLPTAEAKAATAKAAVANAGAGQEVARANSRRDIAAAQVEVAGKRAALAAATEEARLAEARRFEVPLDAPPSERDAANVAAQQAVAAVGQAQAELDSAIAAAGATQVNGRADVLKARSEATKLVNDAEVASAEVRRARVALRNARRTVALAAQKVRLLTRPPDTATLQRIVVSSGREARRTQREVARLAREGGVQVPANEMLFFPNVPLRVDAVSARRGSTVSGKVMNVTNSRLAIDSSVSVSDARLVRPGDSVLIEDPDLGIRTRGTVTRVADTPGTNGVDPNRFYLSITPRAAARALVGASVKLTIAVQTTKGEALAVPVSALSVGGDGSSRVEVYRRGRAELVRVEPGLAAEGLVEVRPTDPRALRPGELVIVGRNPRARARAGP